MNAPDLLPAHLIGAYTHFNQQLTRWHGISVRPLHYLRLVLDAAGAPATEARGGRLYVTLLISGRHVQCIYDPRGSGALITCFWPRPVVDFRVRNRQEFTVLPDGKRRKFRRDRSLKGKNPYRRPAPGAKK